ncbi:MAG: PIN domain-containing protein [Micrococcales bacterium]|nr:PIN domain-containing protein [Micrococcales bacterium]
MYLADANVLYSRVLRDYLLYSVRARLISVTWSQSILDEVTKHLMQNRPGFTQESADRLARAMNTTFPYAQHDPGDAELQVLAELDLPDADDRHVIAAALAADALFICTHNTKDFPPAALIGLGLTAITPDDLLCQLISEHRASMLWVHHASVESLPGATDRSTLRALHKAGAPRASDLVKSRGVV